MTLVNLENPTKLDLIHIRRMFDAFARMSADLLLQGGDAAYILHAWNITLLPGPRVGIEYPSFVRQILEKELVEAKKELEKPKELPKRKGKKKS